MAEQQTMSGSARATDVAASEASDAPTERGGDAGDNGRAPPSGDHDHQGHHEQMLRDFRRRFWASLVLTVPILALSPMLQGWLGVGEEMAFAGDDWVLLSLSAVLFIYGGWPFLRGLGNELRDRRPGMMTLIGLAISVAFGYSALVVLGVRGRVFFWEVATLIDVMLLGHWIGSARIASSSIRSPAEPAGSRRCRAFPRRAASRSGPRLASQ
ncbi:MAG: hypothetical protein ACF8R7_09520 [Phycisphaerales bacterium JB039]